MKQLKMTFASWPYDRTEALKDGVVKPRGIDLKFLASHPGDTFLRMLEHQEFESSEMSMSSLLMEKERQNRFVAIPVFTSRTFRHNGLFVRTDSEIREPQDLIGKKVGLPEYTITSTLWIRGILEHEYGVHPSTVEWYVERWGRGRSHAAALDFSPPDGVKIRRIPDSESQFTLLKKGKLDAAFVIQEIPSGICRSSLKDFATPETRRLFENYKQVEMDYYRKTGIFPIMHTVVLRRDIYERNKWSAMSLYDALLESKRKFYDNIAEWELFSFPWIRHELEEQRELMGDDPYPYGLEANRKVLEAICQYSHEQGLTRKVVEPETLFADETLAT
ncbi:MAG: ABC transporter substrate-binding protein [Thaumarchaeota archaeon]|nr:MAG: ABC transporter substrate-binding protein [Nitrososphaerota archaeon]